MKRRTETEPETRVGHCCGCSREDALYKIPGMSRYRCAGCFRTETGYWHHLTPSQVKAEIEDGLRT